jgi:hypothetical protein
MHFKIGIPTVLGGVLDGAGFWHLFKWVLDWTGRYDAGHGIPEKLAGAMIDFPWFYALLVLAGIGFIWWDRYRGKKEISVTITPMLASIILTVCALTAWGWFFYDRAKGPIIWTFGDGPHPLFDMRGDGNGRVMVHRFQFTGTNRSDQPIMNVDGSLRSNLTNEEIPLFFDESGQYFRAIDTRGIPARHNFMLIAPFSHGPAPQDFSLTISNAELLDRFGDATLTVTFDGAGSPFTRRFTREELAAPIDEYLRSTQGKSPPRIIPK